MVIQKTNDDKMIHVVIGNRHEYWETEAYNRPIGDWRRKPYYVCYCYELKEQKGE